MKVDKKTIENTAELAKLYLSDQDKEELTKEMSDIITYVEKISELETSDIKPTDNIADLKNVFREDVVKESIDRSEIEKIAPQYDNNYFVVPKIIEGSH